MATTRSWILAGVAALAAGTASAADRTAPAVAVDYVKLCDAQGNGFFFIPGTETCLRIGGYVRFDGTIAEPTFYDPRIPGRTYNIYSTLARGRLELDARTMTELGLLRSFIQVQNTVGGTPAAINQYTGLFDPAAAFIGGASGRTLPELRQGYIQLGGFTAGRAFSFFNLPYFTTFSSPNTADAFVNLTAYTFQNGGFTASVSIEDATQHRNVLLYSPFFIGPGGLDQVAVADGYGGQRLPDLIGRLTYGGDWGGVQLSGALHQVFARNSFTLVGAPGIPFRTTYNTPDEFGFAVQFGGELFIPTSAAPSLKDKIYFGAVYAKGALQYAGIGADEDRYGSASGFVEFDGFQRDCVAIGLLRARCDVDLTSAAGGHIGILHHWAPTWRSSASFTYTRVMNTPYQVVIDYDRYRAIADLVWTPTPGLQIGAELVYDRADFPGIVERQTAFESYDRLQGILRVQRNF